MCLSSEGKQGFQHTAARRRLGGFQSLTHFKGIVSTHSRPKAAGSRVILTCKLKICFNTQPPEGGWNSRGANKLLLICFNTQPPEGGWRLFRSLTDCLSCFNTQPPEGGWATITIRNEIKNVFQHTAARRRLGNTFTYISISDICFNTQPPEGGWVFLYAIRTMRAVSTHSRPKAAGPITKVTPRQIMVSTHSRPKAAGPPCLWLG